MLLIDHGVVFVPVEDGLFGLVLEGFESLLYLKIEVLGLGLESEFFIEIGDDLRQNFAFKYLFGESLADKLLFKMVKKYLVKNIIIIQIDLLVLGLQDLLFKNFHIHGQIKSSKIERYPIIQFTPSQHVHQCGQPFFLHLQALLLAILLDLHSPRQTLAS